MCKTIGPPKNWRKPAFGSLRAGCCRAPRLVDAGDVTKTEPYRDGRASIHDEGSQLVAMLLGNDNQSWIAALLLAARPRCWPKKIRARRSCVRSSSASRPASACTHEVVKHPRAWPPTRVNPPFQSGFDRILADVPCSGTGTLSRNPEIKWRLTPDDLLDLQSRQTAILKATLALLAPGGRLLYSTCSLEREENEDVVSAALGEASELQLIDCRQELAQTATLWRVGVEGS